jgi:pimeloyl-ACP methyl ester carboxylesterase
MSAAPIQTKHQFLFLGKSFEGVSWKFCENPKEWIIALHGFGRSPMDFEKFATTLNLDQGLLAISFFAHNNSDFFTNEETKAGWPAENWANQLSFLLDELHIEKCSILCYSLGGRLGLKWIELCPEKISAASFYAPDGLIRNKLYRFTVGTRLGHWFGQRITINPKPALRIARALNQVGLLSKKLLAFVEHHLKDKEIRERVFNVWMGYRHCYPNLKTVATNLKCFGIEAEFTFGKFDAIIPWKHGKKLRQLTKNNPHVFWKKIDKGHNLL